MVKFTSFMSGFTLRKGFELATSSSDLARLLKLLSGMVIKLFQKTFPFR